MEIERRFVLVPCSMKRFLKSRGIDYETFKVEQFYLVAEGDRVERYRRFGDRFVKTVKTGRGLVRQEIETPIDARSYEDAKRRNHGGVIRKIRRVFKYEGYLYELDSFKSPFKGLHILEIEFAHEREALSYRLPEIFREILLAEVTGVADYSNGALSKRDFIPSLPASLSALLTQIEERENFLKASVALRLEPLMPCAYAIKGIFHSLHHTIEVNRRAILSGDKDTERLHQFRVAMRKMRALLSQTSPLFDPQWYENQKSVLAALMRRTGAKRDIDVYLGLMRRYREMIPETHHEGLHRLEDYLKSVNVEEERKLLAFMGSDELVSALETIETFALSEKEVGLRDEAMQALSPFVKRLMKRRYTKVIEKGSSIDFDAPAGEYHELRIEVKKLRYMMEFYASLMEPQSYETMIGRLKKLQTILGDHQDLEVQRGHLKAFTKLPDLHDTKTREAIDTLRHVMTKLEKQKRREFHEIFGSFVKTSTLFHRMVCRF